MTAGQTEQSAPVYNVTVTSVGHRTVYSITAMQHHVIIFYARISVMRQYR